jgi:transposase-like protein
VTDFLGRSWYEHNNEEGKRKGYRNGYYDRQVKTSEGLLELRQPRVRDTEEEFRSRILERLDSLEDNLKYLSREMYIRGMSTRDIEDTFRDDSGEALLSKSSVSRLNSEMTREYEEFCSRDLSELDAWSTSLLTGFMRLCAGLRVIGHFCVWASPHPLDSFLA